MFFDAITDALIDGIKLLPFLFVTYLMMEYIEHKTSQRTEQILQKSGKWGAVLGGILGVVPQCGFSAAASNLYAGRIITLGTLFSVFLSTSDEMLPILISEQVHLMTIIKILGMKAIIGIVTGLVIDLWIQRKKDKAKQELRIDRICDHHHCHCGEGKIIRSALSHTLQIFFFILLISVLLNLLIGMIGEEKIGAFLSARPVLGPLLAGIVGLIPNCASSVALTQLYLEGMLGAGSMLAGLLSGTGVGLLVLFKVNDNLKENIQITCALYGIGAAVGILIEFITISYNIF